MNEFFHTFLCLKGEVSLRPSPLFGKVCLERSRRKGKGRFSGDDTGNNVANF